jgi:hypothetical protein
VEAGIVSERAWDDYDLAACLRENPDVGVTPEGITAILAVWEGANDEDSWRWIVALTDGRFALIEGWCDYTGWDCASGAFIGFADSAEAALDLVGNIGGWRDDTDVAAKESLTNQLRSGKVKTWREAKDEQFGVKSVYVPERDR